MLFSKQAGRVPDGIPLFGADLSKGPFFVPPLVMTVLKSLFLFTLAGICEIGGGYLIWLWFKEDRSFWYGICGALLLSLYGVVATYQTASFGRVYATYGGVFIILSLLWAWRVDHFKPDRYDIIGALICIVGVLVMFYTPRTGV
jgi:small multidrug resistance family-3 protein